MKELITIRLKLRPIQITDIKEISEYSTDLENTKYMYTDKSIEETTKYVTNCIENYDKEEIKYLSYVVCLHNKVIGEVFACIEKDIVTNLGWIINKRYWYNGYGQEAIVEFISFLKNDLNIKEINARCDINNVKCIHLMNKLNMVYTNKSIENGIEEYNYILKL